MPNLSQILDRFKCNLKNAPFSLDDANLIPVVGACTACKFNTAAASSLFPEMELKAVCTSQSCFQQKCKTSMINTLKQLWLEAPPAAVVFYDKPPFLVELMKEIPGMTTLPQYNAWDVISITPPRVPDQKDYILEEESGEHQVEDHLDDEEEEESEDDEINEDDDESDEDENLDEDDEDESDYDDEDELHDDEIVDDQAVTGTPDVEAYQQAMLEYQDDLDEYEMKVTNGEIIRGILITDSKWRTYDFYLGTGRNGKAQNTMTAKQVQDAIKAKLATPVILKGEIVRINSREDRSKVLDKEKVQKKVHGEVNAYLKSSPLAAVPGTVDELAVRLLIYQSLEYSARHRVDEIILYSARRSRKDAPMDLIQALEQMTPEQFGFLLRTAISSKSEATLPNTDTGRVLYRLAASLGVDVEKIEKDQQDKVDTRIIRQTTRIHYLEKMITKLEASQN